MGGDWQQLMQSVLIGLIFSYLLAKLISFVTAFKDDNLFLSRSSESHFSRQSQSKSQAAVTREKSGFPDLGSDDTLGHFNEVASRVSDDNSVRAEQGSVVGADSVLADTDADDDWEGVECTELDELFSAATAFVAASAVEKLSHEVSNEVQLQLYGLYKIATEGPCSAPAPPAFKMTARAKWQAWQRLGAMPPEDAMQKYVDIVTELFPSWSGGSTEKNKGRDADPGSSESRGAMGPVFSTFAHEEEYENQLKMDAIHAFAREGDIDNLLKCIENGVSVNLKDSEGRTPLHWAVDRGHLSVVQLLINKNGDINTKDDEGQTPLHYAVICDREAIAEFLVKNNADAHLEDNGGSSPCDLCERNWPFMGASGNLDRFE
ncbi:hypothetical protein Nepgr_020187 [Nepenthes gracilis]|uniref:ACB domain-containing protein n=1 Tax=Nepenthes gracilis TaxID=150966 RepID=A0AAD3XW39_NEPGR|nr:hypothetical protein Nepgr_020187 [Nepenthes gracilis]